MGETKTLNGICPEIDEILKDTFGCIIYQEQVMLIVHRVFKLSMGKADMVRRAIGKKDPELMAKMIKELEAVDTGLEKEQVEHIIQTIAECSSYLFNKSHSSAYAYTAYQTAYLKTYYPKEFYTALLNSDINAEKTREYISEVRNANIEILPPHCLFSDKKWKVEGSALRYGLEKIKNIGSCEINKFECEHQGCGDWLISFCNANPTLNKQVIISMAKANCFDCSPEWCIVYVEWFKEDYKRRELIEERLEKYKDNPKKQVEWLGKRAELSPAPFYFETSLEQQIEYQKEVLGFSFISKTQFYDMTLVDKFNDVKGGVVVGIKTAISKKGSPMMFIDLDEGEVTKGYIMFDEGNGNMNIKVALGDVIMVKKKKYNPWQKSSSDRTVITEVLKAKKK